MTSCDTVVVKETEPVPGMLLISPQAVMFEPVDYQTAPPADDEACDEAVQRDWIIVPMDSISSIMISHHCDAVSSRSVSHTHPYLLIKSPRGLYALMLSVCLSVRLSIRSLVSPVKFVKSFARWQHLVTSGRGLVVSKPIQLFTALCIVHDFYVYYVFVNLRTPRRYGSLGSTFIAVFVFESFCLHDKIKTVQRSYF